MSQVSPFLRRFTEGYLHWCPGCERPHQIWTEGGYRWEFDGNLVAPTFNPSVKVTYPGPDAGTDGAPPACCHYFLHAGQIQFCGDSTHALAGQTVPLPVLPDSYGLRDP